MPNYSLLPRWSLGVWSQWLTNVVAWLLFAGTIVTALIYPIIWYAGSYLLETVQAVVSIVVLG